MASGCAGEWTAWVAKLSNREVEVLHLVSAGKSNAEVALGLGISPNTVKRHVDNIFNKLGVDNRVQAAVWAAKNNLL
jgi:DNA-binding NarL/FixJ family response regulator